MGVGCEDMFAEVDIRGACSVSIILLQSELWQQRIATEPSAAFK